MEISFRTRKLQKEFSSGITLKRKYGNRMALTIMARIGVLKNAGSLQKMPESPPERRHQINGRRVEQFAVDLVHPYRLVFEPDHSKLPRKEDRGIDLEQVTAIRILEVIDYH